MKFKIVYDKPGRIRLRCGAYAFEKEYEESLYNEIVKNEFVSDAEVHYENGGILITYRKGHRTDVLTSVLSINTASLEKTNNSEYSVKKIDDNFKSNIAKLVVKRCIMKAFIPVPVANVITIIRGIKYIKKALKNLLDFKLNVEVLDGASIFACIAQKNFNTAGSVMFLLSISSLLEDYTRSRTRAALTDSLAIKTDKVWLVTDENTDVLIPMDDLKVGDKIRVRTGSVIPVDGVVESGEAFVDESSMTGESASVMKKDGSFVFAGTVIEEGSVVIEVKKLSSDTKISKIIELIDNSENLKAGVQSKAERLADRIVPLSFIAFLSTLVFTRNVTKAVSLLMVDYSCAIKLSTPIAVISAIKEAADMDITVKGGKYLEAYAEADAIVFDKTGTLTNAEPALEKILPFNGYSEDEVLKIAACLEEHFPHSVAKAIVKAAAERGIDHAEEHAEVKYIVAHGIASDLNGQCAIIGSRHFVCDDEGVVISDDEQNKIDSESGASSVIYLAIGEKLSGALCITDPPRAEAKSVIHQLKKSGIKNITMLTGDSEGAAKITAEKLGIDSFMAQVLPEDKHKYVEKLKEEGYKVIMIGDGINDAPALAAADVSVAMSDASDIAKETADITLVSSDLNDLIKLRNLSTKLMKRISRNYRFIVSFNTALLVLGFIGTITPSTSALLHNTSTMAICAKSMTKLDKKDTKDKR
ncbi:MAG: heavy metal translocating P-type ATPase [Oscillospiraceae bacterium]|nr:heavy metal translocating P-type ATPase [Oscillospiraceae bacterium]MDD6085369.1 heavy metal translocating P-type ATPase [Oscillospiraceae bacterium]MDY3258024.1 heavy metal translocating P-type ATPase [Ruminococcus callidus]